jgi:predicted dehydrogenase
MNGSFVKPRGDVQEAQLQLGKKPNVSTWGTEDKDNQGIIHYHKNGIFIREKIKSLQGNYYDFYDAMYRSITNNEVEPVTATDGLNVMKIIEAAVKSSNEGKVITL